MEPSLADKANTSGCFSAPRTTEIRTSSHQKEYIFHSDKEPAEVYPASIAIASNSAR